MSALDDQNEVRRLPLAHIHEQDGARFAPFAGYNMPVRFGSILEEHAAVRERAGIFDVSHMGEVFVRGPRAAELVQWLLTNDVSSLDIGQAKYGALCNEQGGIIDDVIVYRTADEEYLICVNASRRGVDAQWIKNIVGDAAEVADESDAWGQFAVQGPAARAIVDACCDVDALSIGRFRFASAKIASAEVLIARTGYTGEDGFEVFVGSDDAESVYRALREAGKAHDMQPIGLGARDTLRLEAGLLLYGTDMDEDVSPLEAGIGFAVKLDGEDFIGAEALREQRSHGIPRAIVGLKLTERGALRGGEDVLINGQRVGVVTSASIAPSLDKAMIAHALVGREFATNDVCQIQSRNKQLEARIVSRPFYNSNHSTHVPTGEK